MRLAVLSLSVACLALWSAVAQGKPLMVLSSPNVLRVGATENILVECQRDETAECQPQNVQIVVLNHPTRNLQLAAANVDLNAGNKFQAFVEVKIPADQFTDDPELRQYVVLEAAFNDETPMKKTVLVTLQSNYIFIQTDKPLYTPDSKVKYRMFGVTPDMRPVGEGDNFININIVTPDNIVIPKPNVALKSSGMLSGEYALPDIARIGTWRVEATFETNKQKNYSAEFEVKEYVLPSFEVKITMEKEYFYVEDEELNIEITAMYLFGKEVQGDAFVVFGIFDRENKKLSIPSSFQHVLVSHGQAKAKLTKAQIQKSFQIESMEGSSFYVSVTVLTGSGSELVEAEKRGIHIVKSPYTIHFKKTPKYFPPTMYILVGISVELPDGSPAAGVPLLVNPGGVRVVTSENGFARAPINPDESSGETLTITARTTDPHISLNRQKSASITLTSYRSSVKTYLQIDVGSDDVRVGSPLQISLNHNAANTKKTITYLIQSAGRLLTHGKTSHSDVQTIKLLLSVLPEMLPSFRIIAYFSDQGEVVSDAVRVDVVERCMGSLRLTTKRDLPSRPRERVNFKITGDPGSTVGLVAVDKGVYVLNNKNRLTQKKVWDVVQEADTGCTPGGGMDNMGVFYDAGLMFHSNLQQTANRQDSKCPTPSTRTGRSAPTLDVRSSLLGNYTEPLLRECCLDGMAETPLSYNCERRSTYISDGLACEQAFLKCCTEMSKIRTEHKAEALYLARSEEKNIVFKDSGQIDTRSKFPESWMWVDVKLPLCPDGTTSCKETSVDQVKALEDSITTWHLTGISLSPVKGICVDDTFKIVVQKEFFIDLRLPYSAVCREQIEIKAVLHNYLDDEITVEVHLREEKDVCSSAYKHGQYTERVKVAPRNTLTVPFVIIPMKPGNIPVTVKASVGDQQLEDGVTKHLRVVPPGTKKIVRETRNLKVNQGEPEKLEIMKTEVPRTFIVKGSPENSEIYVSGGSPMNVLVEKVLSGTSMGRLIKQPYGCGEQNMITMTLPLIATVYLDKTHQWDVAGDSKRDEALQYIRDGYNRELNYRTPDGAFTTFEGGSGISWLTSYVAKVFAMAYHLEDIDLKIVCGAIKWVVLNAQMPDGSIKEVGQVVHGEMMGDLRGMDTDASMTAFSLIAMQEAEPHCSDTVHSMPGSIKKAIGYLEQRLRHLTNPYAVAMVSYALANANKLNKAILFKFASQDSDHWPVKASYHFTVEATAYALLALVKAGEFEDAAPIVRWMTRMGHPEGGFSSTQATIMAYQALAEYWIGAKEQRYELDIDIKVSGRSQSEPTIRITNKNAFQTRTTKFKGLNKEVNVTATGTGEATVSIVSMYYSTASDEENNCEMFDLSVTLSKGTNDDLNILKLKIEFLYKSQDTDSGMVILDISMLTGYIADREDLKKLTENKDRIISRYEEDKLLSDRGSIIIYLRKVSHKLQEEVAFRIIQKIRGAALQPAAVSIYDYYNAKQCTKYYHPARKDGRLINLCRNDVCKCAEEECSMQKKGEISDQLRKDKICDAEAKIDYAYKVSLTDYDDNASTDYYHMLIDFVIKEGSGDKSPVGQHRRFIGYTHCRTALDLKKKSSYLIMGSLDTDRENNIDLQYVLGESTWIEYWPTPEECQSEKFQETCNGLDILVRTYAEEGCID